MDNSIAVIQSIFYVLLSAFIYLFAVLFVFKIFKIKDSRAFIFLLLLAMLKPYSAALKLSSQYNLFSFICPQFPFFEKINNIFHYRIVSDTEAYFACKTFIYVLFAILIFGTMFLFFQHIYGIKKMKNLKNTRKCHNPDILMLITKYCKDLQIRVPEIYLAENDKFGFFTSGFIKNMIVLNGRIFDSFNSAEKETIILHELSHIKRRDNVLNIFLYYFNLINFFNPITYLAYFLIKEEQEKDCDRMVMKYSKKTSSEIAKSILTSMLKIKNLSCGFDSVFLKTASFFSISKTILNLKVKSRIYFLINTEKTSKRSFGLNIFLKAALYILFIALFFL